MMTKFLFIFVLCLPLTTLARVAEHLKLPNNFSVETYAEVPDARQMAISPKGIIYVGSMDARKVYAIDKAKKVHVVAENLNTPQGVLWNDGALYIAEVHRISKIDKIDDLYLKSPKLTLVKEFPSDKHHGWKTIAIGPDNKIYVPIGAPCNVCDKPAPYQSLLRMNIDGTQLETVVSGIRNTVGFTWHPDSKLLYFTEMGRDMMGDDIPPDEINVITKTGQHFGFPYLHAGKIKDPQFGDKVPKDLVMSPPLHTIQAHSSPIGIAFFPKDKYPKEYHQCFLVAEHGSWNRSKKAGYQVSKGCLKDDKVVSWEPFITGFKEGEKVFGRPVHFLFLGDGSFLLSEDSPGTVLKFTFKK